MSRAVLIYPLRRRLEKELAKAEADQYNAEIITSYYKERSSRWAPATVLNELIRLNIMSGLLGKKFEEATRHDIRDLIYKLDNRGNAPRTINKCREILKNFYRWMHGFPKGHYPEIVSWIETRKLPEVSVTEDDLIPYDVCIKIAEQATCLRDKAWMLCKLDSGVRIGEIITPKIGEVRFNEHGAVAYSEGKTGRQPIILTWSAATLAQLLNDHPFKDDKEAPVFCIGRKKPRQLTYAAAYRAFKKAVKKSGVDKRVWPHLFKHVSSTEDSLRGVPDSYRRYKHHWTPNSNMPKVYEHLSAAIIPNIQQDAWNRFSGEKREVKQEQSQTIALTKACRRCKFENPRDSAYCNKCFFSLDDKIEEKAIVRSRIEEVIDALADEPEVVERLFSLKKT